MGQKKRNSNKKTERTIGLLIKLLDNREQSIPQITESLLNEKFENKINLSIFQDRLQPPEFLNPDNIWVYFKELERDKIEFATIDKYDLKKYSRKRNYVPSSGLKNRYMLIANELVEKEILIKNQYSKYDIRYHLNPDKIFKIFDLIFTFLFPKIDELLIENLKSIKKNDKLIKKGEKSIAIVDIEQKFGLFAYFIPEPTILSYFIKTEIFQQFSQNIFNMVQKSKLTPNEKYFICNRQYSYILSVMSQKSFVFLTFLQFLSESDQEDFQDPQKWEMFAVNCFVIDCNLHNDTYEMSKFMVSFEDKISKIRENNDSQLRPEIINEIKSDSNEIYTEFIKGFKKRIKEDNDIPESDKIKSIEIFEQAIIECNIEMSKI